MTALGVKNSALRISDDIELYYDFRPPRLFSNILVISYSSRLFYYSVKNATVGSALVQVVAVDEDIGLNGAVRYRLKADPSGHWKYFDLQPVSGILELRLPLDRKKQKIYDVSSYIVSMIIQLGG